MPTGNWFYDNLMARRQAQEMADALERAKRPRRPGGRLLLWIILALVVFAYAHAK